MPKPKKPIEPEDEDVEDDDTTDAESEAESEEETEADEDGEKAEGEDSGAFSWDSDDAESGGLPEGRVVLLKPHTRLASTSNYTEDDDDGVPVLSIVCVPVDGGDPFDIHLSAGKSNRMVPTEDGSSFQPAEGSRAKGLSKSSNCFYFIKSLEDAGFPKDKIRAGGIKAIHGTEIELIRPEQPKRKGIVSVDEEEGRVRTMPAVATIYSLPWEKKGLAARTAAEAQTKGKGKKKASGPVSGKKPKPVIEDDDDDDTLAPAPSPKAGNSKKEGKANGNADPTTLAEKAIMQALSEPGNKKKGLPESDVYPSAFQYVQKDPQRKQIMALVKDDDWVRDDDRPWAYDANLERLTLVG